MFLKDVTDGKFSFAKTFWFYNFILAIYQIGFINLFAGINPTPMIMTLYIISVLALTVHMTVSVLNSVIPDKEGCWGVWEGLAIFSCFIFGLVQLFRLGPFVNSFVLTISQ